MNKTEALKIIARKAKNRLAGKETNAVNTKIKIISNEDIEFKSKVEFLLSQEDVVTNPVHYLIDDKILKNMDDASKERYLLNTLDKYNALRHELENLNTDSRFCM